MNVKLRYVLFGMIVLFIFILFVVTDSNIFRMSASSENTIKVEENNNSSDWFIYKNNIIEIDFNKMNELLYSLNDYIDYNDSLKNIYNTIVQKYDDLKDTKMYNKGDKKVLEVKLKYDEAADLFNKFIEINSDVIVKVYFDKNTSSEDVDVEKINFKINRESIIRSNIVKTAKAELNKTGETYWKWYGYNRRVEWCCVFVSWVANQNGVLNTHIPKFIWVKKGVDYYREKNQLKRPREYTPKPGDVIFFEWNGNTIIDHVGLVEKVEKGYVYTIEGNVNYLYVKEKKYKLNSPYIYAYGVPDYSK